MSNERERLARQWAEATLSFPSASAQAYAAAEHIMATTTEPTMAGAGWDDEKHFLAGATYAVTQEPMVMIGPNVNDFTIDCVAPARNSGYRVHDHMLTPNGKRYELREVSAGEPDVRRARALVEELARDHNLHSLTDGKLAHSMNEVLDALAGDKSEHPETLCTAEDYENAPEGTIVAHDGCDSWVKTNTNIWACGVVIYVNRDMSATGPYRVLRWGWGE